jgi:hypothetical protein
MDPADPIDHSTFYPMDIVFLRPLQTLLKVPITAIKRVGMETYFDHGYRSPFEETLANIFIEPARRPSGLNFKMGSISMLR